MKTAYSINARLGASGIGYIAWNAVVGIHAAGLLERLHVSSNAQSVVPPARIREWGTLGRGLKYLEAKDRTGFVGTLNSMVFDRWVAATMPRVDVFHGWNGMCLESLRRARRMGAVTIVERASSHPATQIELLRHEFQRWEVPFRVPSSNLRRSLRDLEEADRIVIPSAFVRQSLLATGIPEGKLIEIPFGFDPLRFSPAASVPSHPFRAVFAGQVSLRKGVPYLLDAWQRLGWTEAELWIVGAPSADFAAIRHRWPELAGVQFISHTTDLAARLQQSDVFVFPTIEEGSALVIYEAMGCGLPIVTTPNAGSIVRDAQDGFIVPIRDVAALCDRLERLRADTALRRGMAQSARAWVEHYTWSAYQSRLVVAYHALKGA